MLVTLYFSTQWKKDQDVAAFKVEDHQAGVAAIRTVAEQGYWFDRDGSRVFFPAARLMWATISPTGSK